jgi:hypothetical protein
LCLRDLVLRKYLHQTMNPGKIRARVLNRTRVLLPALASPGQCQKLNIVAYLDIWPCKYAKTFGFLGDALTL